MAIKFASTVQDTERIQKYSGVLDEIEQEIATHFNGNYIFEDSNRQIDSSVINALNISFNDLESSDVLIAVTDVKVAKTVQAYNDAFCDE